MYLNLILIMFVLAVVQLILDKIFKKTDDKISYTDGNSLYKLFIVIGVMVAILFFFFVNYDGPNLYIGSGVLLVLLFGVRSIFEWRYIRSSQKHVVSIWMMAISLVGTIIYVFIELRSVNLSSIFALQCFYRTCTNIIAPRLAFQISPSDNSLP